MIYVFRILPLDSQVPYVDLFLASSKDDVIEKLINDYNRAKRSAYPQFQTEAGVMRFRKVTFSYFDNIFTKQELGKYVYDVVDYVNIYGQRLNVADLKCEMTCVSGLDLEL